MTAGSEEAKAELKEAERKLADAKVELTEAEAKFEQVEQKLMETKQADPANTAEIQRLEQKLHTLNGDVAVLRRAFYSKSASVESKEEVVRRLESQLPAIAGHALASLRGERKLQRSVEHSTHKMAFFLSLARLVRSQLRFLSGFTRRCADSSGSTAPVCPFTHVSSTGAAASIRRSALDPRRSAGRFASVRSQLLHCAVQARHG